MIQQTSRLCWWCWYYCIVLHCIVLFPRSSRSTVRWAIQGCGIIECDDAIFNSLVYDVGLDFLEGLLEPCQRGLHARVAELIRLVVAQPTGSESRRVNRRVGTNTVLSASPGVENKIDLGTVALHGREDMTSTVVALGA